MYLTFQYALEQVQWNAINQILWTEEKKPQLRNDYCAGTAPQLATLFDDNRIIRESQPASRNQLAYKMPRGLIL